MTKKQSFKIALCTLAVTALGFGIFFGIRYVIKIKNTAVIATQQFQMVSKFLTQNFPDQVKAFDEANKVSK